MRRLIKRYVGEETGAATFLMLYIVAALLILGGMTMDIANRYRAQAALQAVADLAATSAAIRMGEPLPLTSPRAQARRVVKTSLSGTNMMNSWTDRSFEFGRVDDATGEFTPVGEFEGPNAARVTLLRSPLWDNGEPTFLLRIIGIREWDIRVRSVARLRKVDGLPCPESALSVQARVGQGRRGLFAGVCLDARADLSFGQPPWLTDSARDMIGGAVARIVTPPQSLTDIRFLSAPVPRDALATLVSEARPVRGDMFSVDDLVAGASLRVSCPASGVLRLRGPLVLTDTLLLSECPVRFDSDVQASASLILTNLAGLLRSSDDLAPAVDGVLKAEGGCDPGEGMRLYLFASAGVTAGVPELGLLSDLLSGVAGPVVDELGGLVTEVGGLLTTELAELELGEDLINLCLGASGLLQTDRVALQ